jgi:hypothetical protein
MNRLNANSWVSIAVNLFRLRFEFTSREDVEPGDGVPRLIRLMPELDGE